MNEPNWPPSDPLKSPFWSKLKYAPINGECLTFNWVLQAFAMDCMMHPGKTFQSAGVNGVVPVVDPNDVVQRFVDLGGRAVTTSKPHPHSSRDTTTIDQFLLWENGAADISASSQNVSISYGSTDPVLFERMEGIIRDALKTPKPAGRVFVLRASNQGYMLQSVGLAGIPLVEENYIPEVVEAFNHVVEDMKVDEPCGRITVFDGAPGTGKTFAVRGLLSAVPDATFIMIPSTLVASLGGPDLIGVLLEASDRGRQMILIVEDADQVLASRGLDNMSSVSSLLNLSDGILGATLNLRIVATTNAGHLQGTEGLDEALMRPGRLCRRIHVPPLTKGQAAKVYTRLTGKKLEFTCDTSVAEIYRLAKDTGYKPPPEPKPMGFAVQVTRKSLDEILETIGEPSTSNNRQSLEDAIQRELNNE
jgi:hypothetical protein